MSKKLFFLSLFFVNIQTWAQEEFITPSTFITKFSFTQLTGGVVLLNARFADFPDTLNFVLDTGSGGISLDSTTAVYFGLQPAASQRTIRGIGGIRPVSFLYNQTLHLPGLSVDSMHFHVTDYEMLTSVYGERIDGIIGYSLLSRYIVKVNFDSSYIEFWTQGAIKYPRGGHMFRPSINALPVQWAKIRDNRSINTRFLFDMGAGLNLILSSDFIADSSLLHKKRKFFNKEAEGLGGKIDMKMTVIKEFRLGPYRFNHVPIYIFDDEYNVTSYPYLGGILGNDLLRRFNIILNYQTRQFHLLPNSHFNEPFDYSYTGIELYMIEGLIVLGDVAEGSPAEKAGLKEGDVVLSINRNFVQNLQKMKVAIQNAGQKVKMLIMRQGELMEFEFKVLSIKH